MADKPADETAEMKSHTEEGFPLDEHGLPFNLRLRAEALVAAGKDGDPGERVTPELIAMTADRLEREKAAEEEARAAREAARPSVNMSMSRDELVAVADDIQAKNGLSAPLYESDANKATIIGAIEAARASGMEG